MTDKPTALRLADWHKAMADEPKRNEAKRDKHRKTEAELRRLHEANEAFGQRQEWWNERMFALEKQRDELLEALKELMSEEAVEDGMRWADACDKARDAIARAEDQK